MPLADFNRHNHGAYIFNGCVSGSGYSFGCSLPSIIADNNPSSVNEVFDLVLSSYEELADYFKGPIAYNSLDILVSPIIKINPDPEELREVLSNFLQDLTGKRLTLSLDLLPPNDLAQAYSGNQTEIDLFNQVFTVELEKQYQNGYYGQTILLNIHKEQAWNHPTLDGYLRLAYRYGQPIIQNMLTSTISYEATRPSDRVKEIDVPYQRIGGPSGNADDTGVLGYVCVNLAKIGHDARSEEDFFTLLESQIYEASRILEDHRATIEETNLKLDTLDWLYSAIVLTGMNEGLEYLIDAPLGHVAGKAVTYKVLEYIRRKIEQVQYETGNLYTLESFPSETHNDSMIEHSELTNAYLTRGTELPHHHGNDLWDALEHQKKLQSMYTGASIVDLHVKDGLEYHEGCKLLTRRIVEKFGFSYLAVTPSLIPDNEGGQEIMRVDGVLRALAILSENYKEVHRKRVHYDVKNR